MTWIKICGMTNLEDAVVAAEAGADAVGFVFYEKSLRNIHPEVAREIVQRLPIQIEKVGVFVGESAERVNDLAVQIGLTAVQFYPADGESIPADWGMRQNQGRKFILGVSSEGLSDSCLGKRVDMLLIDSGSGERVGGTGIAFDWENLRGQVQGLNLVCPVIVAGGLNHENVREAIDILKPWGVDVASGVEAKAGKKDPEKVRAFVKAVRTADKST